MYASAWWISPEHNLIPVPHKHINAIIEQPERFGLTRDEIMPHIKLPASRRDWKVKPS